MSIPGFEEDHCGIWWGFLITSVLGQPCSLLLKFDERKHLVCVMAQPDLVLQKPLIRKRWSVISGCWLTTWPCSFITRPGLPPAGTALGDWCILAGKSAAVGLERLKGDGFVWSLREEPCSASLCLWGCTHIAVLADAPLVYSGSSSPIQSHLRYEGGGVVRGVCWIKHHILKWCFKGPFVLRSYKQSQLTVRNLSKLKKNQWLQSCFVFCTSFN